MLSRLAELGLSNPENLNISAAEALIAQKNNAGDPDVKVFLIAPLLRLVRSLNNSRLFSRPVTSLHVVV
jgi:hypothetical protein